MSLTPIYPNFSILSDAVSPESTNLKKPFKGSQLTCSKESRIPINVWNGGFGGFHDYLLGGSEQLRMKNNLSSECNIKWVFPKIGVPQNGWFLMENPMKMDDLGGTTIFGNIQINIQINHISPTPKFLKSHIWESLPAALLLNTISRGGLSRIVAPTNDP